MFIKNVSLIFICITVFVSYKYIIYEPGYCKNQKRLVSDAELIQSALRLREGQIAYYGGIDAYERRQIQELHRPPEEAGRNFDAKDPYCCEVFRGTSETRKHCTIDDYPLCVELRYPPYTKLQNGKKYYQHGRTYFFNDCGELQAYY